MHIYIETAFGFVTELGERKQVKSNQALQQSDRGKGEKAKKSKMTSSNNEYPKPKYVTGGCLCESLRYRIDFPEDHDFEKSVSLEYQPL